MDFATVCSGIEAPSVALHSHGWRAQWFAEIEAFPSAVLAHHWPGVDNLGDMTKIPRLVLSGSVAAPSVLIGGTPCQSFSVAGMRKGLEDDRGKLTKTFVDLADAIDHVRAGRGEPASVFWWENVPGVLSDRGNAFGCFLGALAGESCELQPPGGKWKNAGCVYGPTRAIAWRVLDAQYFGVAQRRRRVFVVASARTDLDPSAVLFEPEGLRRNSPPSRGPGEETAGTLDARTKGGGFPGTDGACAGHVQPVAFGQNRQSGPVDLSHAINAHGGPHGRLDFESETFMVHPWTPPTMFADPPIAFSAKDYGGDAMVDLSPTLRAGGHNSSHANAGVMPGVTDALGVRRLTPVECERLQGFPDDWTRIPWRKKEADECPDGPRYKAIGNSMAVPVIEWIGLRIARACS